MTGVQRHDPPLTWESLWKELFRNKFYVGFVMALTVLFVFCGGASVLKYSLDVANYNNVAESHERLNMLFVNSPTVEGRQELAIELLSLYGQGLQSDVQWQEVEALNTIAINGELHYFPVVRKNWGEYLYLWLPIMVFLVIILFSIATAFNYACYAYDNVFYLVDLPWQRFWPVLFVVLTPSNALFYLASTCRFLYAHPWTIQPERQESPIGAEEPETGEPVLTTTFTEDNKDTPKVFAFNENRQAALVRYSELRSTNGHERLKARLAHARTRLEKITAKLVKLSEKLQRKQQQRAEVLKDIRDLEATSSDQLAGDPATIQQEFDNLLTMRGVAGITVKDDRIVLLVEVRFSYKDAIYDFGDWLVSFGECDFETEEVRKGYLESWSGGDPVYRLDGFCFAEAEELIGEYLIQGYYLEAINLALAQMHQVNADDLDKVASAFRRIT
jgi:hypothetical protein